MNAAGLGVLVGCCAAFIAFWVSIGQTIARHYNITDNWSEIKTNTKRIVLAILLGPPGITSLTVWWIKN